MEKGIEQGPFTDDLRVTRGDFPLAMLLYQRVIGIVPSPVSSAQCSSGTIPTGWLRVGFPASIINQPLCHSHYV